MTRYILPMRFLSLIKQYFKFIHRRNKFALPVLFIVVASAYAVLWFYQIVKPEIYLQSRYVRIVPIIIWIYPFLLVAAIVVEAINNDKNTGGKDGE